MLLRASSQLQGQVANTASVRASGVSSGVDHGDELLAYADAVIGGEQGAITRARQAVREHLDWACVVDAAAVIANFQRMVRIADSTGIPLDEPVLMLTQQLRRELRLNEFAAATRSTDLPWRKRVAGRLLGRWAPQILARMARRRQRAKPSS